VSSGDGKTSVTTVASNLPFEEVAPYPEPVDLGTLLDEIAHCVRRHIVCEKETTYTTALWIALTYLVHLFDTIALLVITAPEMRCGKSELKRLIGKMVLRPVEADNMSVAVLFRSFDLWRPTLLVDEYDTFVSKSEELRGVFNAGHQRGGAVWRCRGDTHVPSQFNVYGAKVLTGIGRLQSTLVDRGIILKLRRKLPSETVVRQRDVPLSYFREIQAKLARAALDYSGAIAAAHPVLPETLSDRAQDNWEPLFQIAQAAGGDWPTRAQQAALRLSGNQEDTKTVGVELLCDLAEAFDCKKVDRLSSAEVVNFLCGDEEKRWSTYNRGAPITATQVARRLRDYGICSNTIRVRGIAVKGYQLRQFADAFARYVRTDHVPVPDVTPTPVPATQSLAVAPVSPITVLAVTGNVDVTQEAPSQEGCYGVTPEPSGDVAAVAAPPATVETVTGSVDVTEEVPSQGTCYGVADDTPQDGSVKVHKPRPKRLTGGVDTYQDHSERVLRPRPVVLTPAMIAAKEAVRRALSGIVPTN
jgi:putative DNA primase/helicase